MKNLFLLVAVPILSFAQVNEGPKMPKQHQVAKQVADGFTVSGNVQGAGDGKVTITSVRGDQTLAATDMKAGMFTMKGSLTEPALYWITIGQEPPHYLFVENAAIKISGTKGDSKNLKIEGSASHKDFAVFEQTFNPLFANLNTIVTEINSATSEAKKNSFMPKYKQALATLHKEVNTFIKARPSSYVSLFVLSNTMQSMENVTDVEKLYNLLNETVKNSAAGKETASYISYAKVGSIGSEALDFTQNDVNDKPVALSSFKGKYVLIDFWASWCRPCRAENPNVVKVFNKFKNKNFTVLGVSLDQQKDAWVKAIEKDNLTWTHVSDLQQWSNAAAQLYKVQSIPQNFLIDPNGKIVAKDLRGEDLEKTLCEYLGCSN